MAAPKLTAQKTVYINNSIARKQHEMDAARRQFAERVAVARLMQERAATEWLYSSQHESDTIWYVQLDEQKRLAVTNVLKCWWK